MKITTVNGLTIETEIGSKPITAIELAELHLAKAADAAEQAMDSGDSFLEWLEELKAMHTRLKGFIEENVVV